MQSFLVQAIYEDGVLKPEQPLPVAEHERVQLRVQAMSEESVRKDAAISRARATSGLLGWTGDAATVEQIALDPEFGIQESP